MSEEYQEELSVYSENTRTRRHWKRMVYVLLSLAALSVVMDFYSAYDRRRLHRDSEQAQEVRDSRAVIQVTTINAGIRAGIYTEEELRLIESLAEKAQYTGAGTLIQYPRGEE